jgi:hypothetical protein
VNLHGHLVGLRVEHPLLRPTAAAILKRLAEPDPPFKPAVSGQILPYDLDSVSRHLSNGATPVLPGEAGYHPLSELYATPERDRWWLVDERWGLCEVDLVRGTWRAFVVPEPSLTIGRLFESTMWWPAAQLLRHHGLHLLPATALERTDGRRRGGVLVLANADLSRERAAWTQRGATVLGRYWSALRIEGDGRATLLPMPAMIDEQPTAPLRATVSKHNVPIVSRPTRPCPLNDVLIAQTPRVHRPSISPLATRDAERLLGGIWPIAHCGKTKNTMPEFLSRSITTYKLRLDRRGTGLSDLLLGPAPRPMKRAA